MVKRRVNSYRRVGVPLGVVAGVRGEAGDLVRPPLTGGNPDPARRPRQNGRESDTDLEA